MQPNQTLNIIDDNDLNTSASIYTKWQQRYGLDVQQSSSLMSFEGLSAEELIKIQASLLAALSKQVSRLQ